MYKDILIGIVFLFVGSLDFANGQQLRGEEQSSSSSINSYSTTSRGTFELIGSSNNPEPIAPRIINGSPASQGEFSWFVQGPNGFCGASLIGENLALTAAHCQPFFPVGSTVYIGNVILNDQNAEKLRVAQVFPHEDYNRTTLENDYMVLLLEGSSTAKPLELNPDIITTPGQILTVMGYGVTENGIASGRLLEVDVAFVDDIACNASYTSGISAPVMMCASKPGKDACQGDSGGPLIDEDERQVGIVSFGVGCANPDFPGVYAEIAGQYDWIVRTSCVTLKGTAPFCDVFRDPSPTPISTPRPTPSPSSRPTSSPTPFPTNSPTPGPTFAPTPLLVEPSSESYTVSVKVTHDLYASETSWYLIDSRTGTTVPGMVQETFSFDKSYETVQKEAVVPPGNYELIIEDTFGDGICCAHGTGKILILVNGRVVVSDNGEFKNKKSISFDVSATQGTSSLMGRLYIESNRNNEEPTFGELEAPISYRPVILLDGNMGIQKITYSNSNGEYSFSGIYAGSYYVMVPTTVFGLSLVSANNARSEHAGDFDPVSGIHSLSLVDGQVQANLDAGYDCFSFPTDIDNLLCNGSFEYSDFPVGTEAELMLNNVPGWRSMNGPTKTLKLHNGLSGVEDIPSGKIFAELDSVDRGQIEGIFQDVLTIKDARYLLSFFIRARSASNADSEDESVVVEWNGNKIIPTSWRAPSGGWEKKEVQVIGTGGVTRLLFRESRTQGASNGSGPFLDDIKLVLVPTPGLTSSPTPSPTTQSPSKSPTPNPTGNPTMAPTPYPTPAPSPFPTPSPTPAPSPSPTPSPTLSLTTDSKQGILEIFVQYDKNPEETAWQVTDENGNVILSQEYRTKAKNSEYYTTTLPVNYGSYKFTIWDREQDGICCKFGTGYVLILVDNKLVASSDGQFTDTATLSFDVGSLPKANGDAQVRYELSVTADSLPYQLDYYVWDSSGLLLSSGASGKPGPWETKTYPLDLEPGKLYSFGISDTGLDGICCSNGEGKIQIYAVVDDVREVLLDVPGDFGSSFMSSFLVPTKL